MCENPKLQQLMENAACEMEKLGYSKSSMQYECIREVFEEMKKAAATTGMRSKSQAEK